MFNFLTQAEKLVELKLFGKLYVNYQKLPSRTNIMMVSSSPKIIQWYTNDNDKFLIIIWMFFPVIHSKGPLVCCVESVEEVVQVILSPPGLPNLPSTTIAWRTLTWHSNLLFGS